MKRILLGFGLLVIGVAFMGCHVHARPWRPHPHHHVRWTPVRGHVHSAHCGHFHHGGVWYHHAGHVHAAGCGHAFRGGIWIVVP